MKKINLAIRLIAMSCCAAIMIIIALVQNEVLELENAFRLVALLASNSMLLMATEGIFIEKKDQEKEAKKNEKENKQI